MTTNAVSPDDRPDAEKFPGVEPAQVFVVPSYTWMLSRVEAADSRLHTLTAFVATVTLAIPATSRAIDSSLTFNSGWFVFGVALAVASVAIGIFARVYGVIHIASPTLLFKRTLHLSKWEFQKDALYRAGEAFDHNRRLVEIKANAVLAMGVLFVVEVVSLLLWIA
jgi:hypothetical protein